MIDHPKSAMSAVVACLHALNVPVSPEVRDRQPQYVRVSRTGGGMTNMVTDRAIVLVECWATTNLDAETLANNARFLLGNASGKTFAGVFVRWCKEVSGPVDFPDVTGSRYQFQIELLASTQ